MTGTKIALAICLATLTAFALSSPNGTAAAGPVSISDLAPADEYFGHMRLSPLGIRHMIFSLAADLHRARRKPDAIEHDALSVQDALQDWSTRYPRDSWLPAALWNLAVLYEELPGAGARLHAIAVLQKIRDDFSGTAFATNARRDLERGIGVRPWPRWAGTPPTPRSSSSSSCTVSNAQCLLGAIAAAKKTDASAALALEAQFWTLSHNGADAAYTRCAWELAARFESLPGETAQTHAIRLLAFLVDRHPEEIFGKWAMRDLKRGVGLRAQESEP